MKKLLNTSALAAFILLYIFAVSVENFTVINPVFLSNPDENTSGYFTDQSAHLFSHTNQSVEIIYNFVQNNFPDTRKLSRIYPAIIQVKANILEQKFVQFTFSERSFPLTFSKPDISYPFHYFL